MTHLTLTIVHYLQNPVSEFLTLITNRITALIESRQHYLIAKATIKELNRLTDKELNDIGIARGDIWAVAHGDRSFVRTNENLKGWV